MSAVDFSDPLRSHLQASQLPSFQALCRQANVSKWQVEQLRRGQVLQMRVAVLQRISQALHLSLPELIAQFSDTPLPDTPAVPSTAALQEEYHRLQAQLAEQRTLLQAEFQQATLQTLETLLLQLPTALHTAQQNPDIPASRLIPLLRPLDQLLQRWGIEAIAPVGSELPYNPQLHQLMDGSAQPGDPVRVRYTGYQQGDRLLYRAKVSPTANRP